MLGKELKKLAEEMGLKQDKGIAYGIYQNCNLSLSETEQSKIVTVSTKRPATEQVQGFLNSLPEEDRATEQYGIMGMKVHAQEIQLEFLRKNSTNEKMKAFVDWMVPKLSDYGFTGAKICPFCGATLVNSDPWVQDGNTAHHMHSYDIQSIEKISQEQMDRAKEKISGSYVGGFLGALLGAILGALVWGLILSFGYIASAVGLLIGFLSLKGYELLKGRPGMVKIVIVILTTLIGVILGFVNGDVINLRNGISSGELAGSLSDIPSYLKIVYSSPEYYKDMAGDFLIGLLFAILGTASMFSKELKANSFKGKQFVRLS